MKKRASVIYVLAITAAIIVFSPLVTYVVCWTIRVLGFNPDLHIGSVDAWITFAGSIIGGSVTLLALYFTLRHESEIKKEERIFQNKPILKGNPIFVNQGHKVHVEENPTLRGQWKFKWKLVNCSSNVAQKINLCYNNKYLSPHHVGVVTILDFQIEIEPYNVYEISSTIIIRKDLLNLSTDCQVIHTILIEYSDALDLKKYYNEFTIVLDIIKNEDSLSAHIIEYESSDITDQHKRVKSIQNAAIKRLSFLSNNKE